MLKSHPDLIYTNLHWSKITPESLFLNCYGPALQNRRLAEVGRDLWRMPHPISCSKQSQLEQVAQDHVQSGFDFLQGWRLQPSLSIINGATLFIQSVRGRRRYKYLDDKGYGWENTTATCNRIRLGNKHSF